MAAQLINIQFHDQTLTAALVEGVPHIAMKPLCENIGLQWEGQHQRIKRHPVLSQVMCMTHITSTGQDGKTYNVEMLMLPLDYLNGWLFGVDASRVKAEIKPRLLDYQRECFKVLANHFMPKRSGGKRGPADNPALLHVSPLELDALVRQRAEQLVEGEVIVKEKDCPKYHYPMSLWNPALQIGQSAWITCKDLFNLEPYDRPLAKLLHQHGKEGDDVNGCVAEYNTLYHLLESFYGRLNSLRHHFDSFEHSGMRFTKAG